MYACLSRGLSFKVSGGSVLTLVPPLTVTDNEIDRAVDHAPHVGDVLGQLAARRCEVQGTEPRPGGVEAIRGMVPLREMFGYATELRSATQGRGLFSMEFDHYATVPPALKREILEGGG